MAMVLVTGANRGIGLELCRQFRARSDTVIAVCRQQSPELEALGARIEAGIDVTSAADISTLVSRLRGTRLDTVVHNAGVLTPDALMSLDSDAIRRQFEVNALAPLQLTVALLPSLQDGSKLAVVTSRMGSLNDNTSGGYYGYRMSKAAVNMAFVCLAIDLRSRKVAVGIIHPGYVRTRMTGGQGDVEPSHAARGILARIDALTLETSGGFWHANGQRLPF